MKRQRAVDVWQPSRRLTLLEELRTHVVSVVDGVDRRAKVLDAWKIEDRSVLRVAILFEDEQREFDVSLRTVVYPTNRLRGWRVAAFRTLVRDAFLAILEAASVPIVPDPMWQVGGPGLVSNARGLGDYVAFIRSDAPVSNGVGDIVLRPSVS
jgi:hypothetical protein